MAADIKWKSSQKKIGGKTKPFIDKNLQIQVPDLDGPSIIEGNLNKPSHFSSDFQDQAILTELSYLEKDLQAAILEAKQTYEAWKKIQARLSNVINTKGKN